MPTESHASRTAKSRIATRHELTTFYRAIGISAVASAIQASKMTAPVSVTKNELPAFLREAHAVG